MTRKLIRKILPSSLKAHLRRAILGFDFENYYFSQCGEDYVLRSLLQKKLKTGKPGFYVDVGAFAPFRHSNTFFFYRRGWRGINIDPRPGSAQPFRKYRPEDINLELGVSDEEGTLNYHFIGEDSPMNSFSRESLERLGALDRVQREIPVMVKRLDQILREHEDRFEQIDFMTIDVEGLDLQVLSSNDWDRFSPSVVAIEIDSTTLDDVASNPSARFLAELGYIAVAKNVVTHTVCTAFFVKPELTY